MHLQFQDLLQVLQAEKADSQCHRRICASSQIRRRQSFLRLSGTECRSCEKTNAVPQKRNGKDCSPGFCSVPIAGISCTLLPARALTASKTTMYAPATKRSRHLFCPLYPGRCTAGTGIGTDSGGQCVYPQRCGGLSGGMAAYAAAPIRNGTSGKIRSAWSRQKAPCHPGCGHVPAL